MRPRAVAVIGASRRPQAVGHCVVQNLLEGGYKGAVYPINPSAQEIAGLRCSPSISAIGAPVELAIVAVPAPIVLDVVHEAADHGVKAIVVLSAGFREAGGEGITRQECLSALARQRNLALVGPNCLGLINTAAEVRLNGSFATRMPPAGPVALLSQSGALTTALLDYAAGRSLGFSIIVSFGNRAGLTEVELLQIAAADPHTRCILLYLEDLADGGDFLAAAEQVTHGPHAKPIVASRRPHLGGRKGRRLSHRRSCRYGSAL
jgi:acetyltransferase